MSDKELVEKLEQLNTTLGAIKDVLCEVGSDEDVESSIRKLQLVTDDYREILLSGSDIGKVIRINRELREQLAMIRDIVSDS